MTVKLFVLSNGEHSGAPQESPSNLFWAWTAFVFVSANLLTGGILAKYFDPGQAMLALLMGLLALCIMAMPAVWIAVEKNWNYQTAIRNTIGVRFPHIALAAVALVPLINIGWFAIQTAMAAESIAILFNRPLWNWWIAMMLAFAFAVGPIFGGFRWLAKSGQFSMVILLALLALFIYEWANSITLQAWKSLTSCTSDVYSFKW
jgi:purine-cytosine permease-like protein